MSDGIKDYVQRIPYITSQPVDSINLFNYQQQVLILQLLSLHAGCDYQWQVSTDGGSTWSNYSGGATNCTFSYIKSYKSDSSI